MKKSRIDSCFEALRQRGETALIPFITAGDPDLDTTAELITVLEEAGADLIELGMPFSDPMADGPTIQAASERALEGGTTLEKVLGMVAGIRQKSQIPLVLMGYYNPVFRYGAERFARDAAAAGIDALLLVDLPPEEVDEIGAVMKKAGIAMITLLAPTTPADRAERLAAAAEGYIYYVSMTGVTGARKITPTDIREAVETLKGHSSVPVAVGFGISTVEDAAAVGQFADGVVVGSALVKIIADHGRDEDLPVRVKEFVSSLKQGLA